MKKTAIHLISFSFFFFKYYLFWCFRNPSLYCTFFCLFFFFSSSCWNVIRRAGWETEAHNRTGRRQLALLHTRVAVGVGGWVWEIQQKKRKENKQRRYVQPPLWTGNRAAAIWWPVTPPNATYFSCFFSPLFL